MTLKYIYSSRLWLTIFFCLVGLELHSQSTVTTYSRSASNSGNWVSRQAKLINLVSGFKPVYEMPLSILNKYGSWKDKKTDATGFFYTKKIDGRWWLVDPEGCVGYNIAVNCIPQISYPEQFQAVYGRLWTLGFNGAGNFMADEDQTKRYNELYPEKRFSYTKRVNFFNKYVGQRKSYYPNSTPDGVSLINYVFVFDPKFEEFCDERAKSFCEPCKNEQDLLGYFLDNEIAFHADQLELMIKDLTPGDPSYEKALEFAISKGLSKEQVLNGNVSDAINKEFATLLAERYYEVTTKAVKKYDPNHMTLGSRLHGRSRDNEGIVKSAAKWCDVVSVNFYDTYYPNDQITSPNKYLKWIDKPLIIGEFYTKGLDAYDEGYVNGFNGAGLVVKTQQDRGYYYQNSCIEFIQAKSVIGWHYFQYADDYDANKGMYQNMWGAIGDEYIDMTSLMQSLNINCIPLANFYDTGQNIDVSMGINSAFNDYSVTLINKVLHITNIPTKSKVSIYNINGQLVHTISIDCATDIDLGKLGAGVYIVKIWNQNRICYSNKIVI